jgi:isopentenyl phosphate kinase
MLTFVKLGGSLITDKRVAEYFHAETMQRTAQEIARARHTDPTLQLLIGHGSGSFGHVVASRYGTAKGVTTPEHWIGFAEVARVARRLNHLVTEALEQEALPILPFSPSSSAECTDAHLHTLAIAPIEKALQHGLIPLVYGDVSFDSVRGGTIISTETVFDHLARALHPQRIFLLGEVEGVYDSHKQIIPRITPANYPEIAGALGGSHGTDVTGGMLSKVQSMLGLAKVIPGLTIHIFGGGSPGQLESALSGTPPGTVISAT